MLNLIIPIIFIILIALFLLLVVWPGDRDYQRRRLDLVRKKIHRIEQKQVQENNQEDHRKDNEDSTAQQTESSAKNPKPRAK